MLSDTKNQLSKEDREFIDKSLESNVKTETISYDENSFMGQWYDEQTSVGGILDRINKQFLGKWYKK